MAGIVPAGETKNMEIVDLLTRDAVFTGVKAGSKKLAVQELAQRAAKIANMPERLVFDVLLERERLGTTGVGRGIAIPHGKMAGLDQLYGVFTRLEEPVDFESVDRQPVDLLFLLLAPEEAGADHLKALARISRLFRDTALCEELRRAGDPDAMFRLLVEGMPANAA
jgi:PTS system nitrogen regulatory IIA component